MEKLYWPTSKTFSKMADERMHTPHPTSLDQPLAIRYNNHKKSVAYIFQSLGTINFVPFNQKAESKKGAMAQCLPLNALLTSLHLFRYIIITGKESSIAFSAIDKLVALF